MQILRAIAWWLLACFCTTQSALLADSRLQLSGEEQAYLDSVEQIRLCTDPDWMPYEAIHEGYYTGIMSDFHQLWSEIIGKPIVLQPTHSWQQSLQFIQQKRCDLLSSAQDVKARRDYLTVTKPFIFYSFAVATQPDHDFIINLLQLVHHRFVMVDGYAGIDMIRQHYPDIEIITVETAKEGLKLVEKGQAFGFIDTVPSINYQTLKYGISHIKINGVLEQQYAMSVGVRKDLPALLSIYNKAIAFTRETDRQRILNNWLSLTFQYEFDYTFLWQVLSSVLVLLGLFAYHYYVIYRYNRQLEQANKRLHHMSHSDPLTGIPNRYYLNQSFQAELKRYQRYRHTFSVVILDIDHFKRINDSFGHVVGDEVIRRLSKLLISHVRENDVVARWGGEEFLILCPETTRQGGQGLAEQLRKQIEQNDFALDTIEVTASFGITEYRTGELIDDCINRADLALYQAKQTGRNKIVVF